MKPIKSIFFDGNVKYYESDIDVLVPSEYEEKDELRAVWISTVANIDLPKIESIESYKEKLLDIIKTMKYYHLNTAIFQVRPTNDAFYESDLNPWSRFITGVEGKNPGFDIFEFFTKECKKENITVHAWINPYRVSTTRLDNLNMTKDEYLETLDDKNFAKRNKDLVIETSETKLILDPSSEVVREFVSDSCLEIAKKYDIKAIHMDDYFYPYDEIKDSNEEEKFKASPFSKLSDYRRDNVNKLIELMHNKFIRLNRKVEFGISPFGIYRTNTKYSNGDNSEAFWEKGSDNHASCFTCYKGLYADVYYWMQQKWIDYVAPQDYFDFENIKPGKDFAQVKYADLAKWWSEASLETNTKLYIGLGIYRYSNESSWSNPDEVINQIKHNTLYPNIKGNIFFTYHDFTDNNIESKVKFREKLLTLWTKDVKEI